MCDNKFSDLIKKMGPGSKIGLFISIVRNGTKYYTISNRSEPFSTNRTKWYKILHNFRLIRNQFLPIVQNSTKYYTYPNKLPLAQLASTHLLSTHFYLITIYSTYLSSSSQLKSPRTAGDETLVVVTCNLGDPDHPITAISIFKFVNE